MSLTKYEEGSFRELLSMSCPLMFASLSVMMMTFFDRWFLAHHSTDAHNAAVGATTLGWAFIFGGISLANVAEVFVAQYNGAKIRHRLGEPVWQMIWFSLFSLLFFIPLSVWGTEFIYGHGSSSALERDYFGCMVLFGPFYCLNGALSGFFIGQGKTRLVTILMVVANVFNVLLDWALIFGVDSWIPAMGVKGAAIATSMAVVFQCIVLGCIFFNAKNRQECGTSNFHFKGKVLWDCLRIGFPISIFMVSEVLAFAAYYALMKNMGAFHITVTGICQTILILFLFFPEGINKATAAIVGNMIGAGRSHLVNQTMKAGLFLNGMFLVALLSVFVLCMPLIIGQFLPLADPLFIVEIEGSLGTCLILVAFYLFFEGIRMQYAGVLMAAGDSIFLFLTGALSVWVVMLLPIYFFVVLQGASVEAAVSIVVLYSIILSVIYFIRVQRGKWRSLSISSTLPLRTE